MPDENEEKKYTFRLADEKAVAKAYEAGEIANPDLIQELIPEKTKKHLRMKEVVLSLRADLEKVELNEEQLNGVMHVLINRPMAGDNWSG